jgi:uncharacterized membrane protein YdjX (TVP38/TMEM64 family)
MESRIPTSSTSPDDIGGPKSNSQNDDMNEPLRFGLGLEPADNDGLRPSFGTDSSSTTVIESVEDSRGVDCGQKDDGNDNDDDVETCIARNTTAEPDLGGDPVDDSNDGNDSEGTDVEEETTESLASPRYMKIVMGVILLMIVLFVLFDAVFGMNYVRQANTVFLEWIRENPGPGVIAFMFVYFIAALICVPAALLTLGAGFVFSASNDGSLVVGVFLGVLAVFVGSTASSVGAFLLARYLLYDRVRRLSEKYSIFEALDIALSEKGFRIMCLLRLSPITPFVFLNYIAGVTTVKLSSYMLSIFCILPGTIMYVFLGASAGSLTDKSGNTTITIIVVTLGVVFGGLAIYLTSHYSRKELNKEVDLVRSRLYNRTTSRRNRQRYRRRILRQQRSRYRRRIDRKREGRST